MNMLTSLTELIFGVSMADIKGKVGESLTAKKLGWIKLFGKDGKLLQNIYIPKPDGTTTEIDLLYITAKGIFVIESKNYSGYIFGNERSPKWTVTLYGGKDFLGRKKVEKIQFYNPIWQNNTHIKFLKKYLGEDTQTISVIVFSERCELKDITLSSKDLYVCNRDQIAKVMKKAWGAYPDILDESQIEAIYSKLEPLTNADEALKQQHIENIHERLDSTEVCPKCGGKLVLRTAKNGPNAGKQFYGCSNYPKCKFTRSLE